MRELFRFPDPVNETSARVVAAGVVAMAAGFLATGSGWLLGLSRLRPDPGLSRLRRPAGRRRRMAATPAVPAGAAPVRAQDPVGR